MIGEIRAHARGTVTRPTLTLGHPFTPGKFDSSRCTVMLARYPCPYSAEQHGEQDGNG